MRTQITTLCALTAASLFAQEGPVHTPEQATAPPAQVSKQKLALERDPADLKVYRDANAKLPPAATEMSR
jgi:hypothetical protein